MWNLKFVTFLLVIFGLGSIEAQEEIGLDITQGSLKGLKTATNINGKPYFSFKGIPYARSMTSSTRFMVNKKLIKAIFNVVVKKLNLHIIKTVIFKINLSVLRGRNSILPNECGKLSTLRTCKIRYFLY